MKRFIWVLIMMVMMVGCEEEAGEFTAAECEDCDCGTDTDTGPEKAYWCAQDRCQNNDDCGVNHPEYQWVNAGCDAWYCLPDAEALDFMGLEWGTCVVPCDPDESPLTACPAQGDTILTCHKTPEEARGTDPNVPDYLCGY